MHFQRIVGSLVSSAVGAGRCSSDKGTEARDATELRAHQATPQNWILGAIGMGPYQQQTQ